MSAALHNFSLFAIFLPKIINIGGNLTKLWQKQFCTVFWDTVYSDCGAAIRMERANRWSASTVVLWSRTHLMFQRVWNLRTSTFHRAKRCKNSSKCRGVVTTDVALLSSLTCDEHGLVPLLDPWFVTTWILPLGEGHWCRWAVHEQCQSPL